MLLRKLQLKIPEEHSTDNELLNLEFDGIEHLLGYICKKLKTEVFEFDKDQKYLHMD